MTVDMLEKLALLSIFFLGSFGGMLLGRYLTRRDDRELARFWEDVAMNTAHELAKQRDTAKAQDRFLADAFRAYTEGRNVN